MTSPEVEFLEERLALLEAWLENIPEDDDNNDDLIQKREEYEGLVEETVLLQKKLRKTSKLLSKENGKSMLKKLSKKQDQYLNEIEEIMNYAESDVLFETAEIEPNELLGEPLETLVEQPGMEGSSASLNFSMSDFLPKTKKALHSSSTPDHYTNEELHPIAENGATSHMGNGKNNIQMESFSSSGLVTLFTISTANSNTFNYDEKTLRKKLRKVEKLLLAEEMGSSKDGMSQLDGIQVRKLLKKKEQYTQALRNKVRQKSGVGLQRPQLKDGTIIVDGEGDHAVDNIEEQNHGSEVVIETNSKFEPFHDSAVSERKNGNCNDGVSHDQKTLKKKLKKIKKMMSLTRDPEELEIYKQKKREYKMALEILNHNEMDAEVCSSSSSRHGQHEVLVQERSGRDEQDASESRVRTSDSASKHNGLADEDNRDEEIELLQKKLRKIVKYIARAREEDDMKTLKKMEKKRLEYQTSLDELLRFQ